MKRKINNSLAKAKLSDHIRELGMRLLVSFFALAITGTIVYLFYGQILTILRLPLNAPLYYDNPAGSFSLIIKICFMGGLMVSIPLIVYNIIMFVRPAFSDSLPKKRVYSTAAFSSLLAITGAIFAYTCILPGTLQFLASFKVDGLNALISADNYLNFVTNISYTFSGSDYRDTFQQ